MEASSWHLKLEDRPPKGTKENVQIEPIIPILGQTKYPPRRFPKESCERRTVRGPFNTKTPQSFTAKSIWGLAQ